MQVRVAAVQSVARHAGPRRRRPVSRSSCRSASLPSSQSLVTQVRVAAVQSVARHAGPRRRGAAQGGMGGEWGGRDEAGRGSRGEELHYRSSITVAASRRCTRACPHSCTRTSRPPTPSCRCGGSGRGGHGSPSLARSLPSSPLLFPALEHLGSPGCVKITDFRFARVAQRVGKTAAAAPSCPPTPAAACCSCRRLRAPLGPPAPSWRRRSGSGRARPCGGPRSCLAASSASCARRPPLRPLLARGRLVGGEGRTGEAGCHCMHAGMRFILPPLLGGGADRHALRPLLGGALPVRGGRRRRVRQGQGRAAAQTHPTPRPPPPLPSPSASPRAAAGARACG